MMLNLEIDKTIQNCIDQTAPLMEKADTLTLDELNALYKTLGEAATLASRHISEIDSEQRVLICAWQDELLDYIIDLAEPKLFENLPAKHPRGVYIPAVHKYRRWSNTELKKDKCLQGYLLSQVVNAEETVCYFLEEGTDYPYQHDMPGVRLIKTARPSGYGRDYYEHLKTEYPRMDVLILNGMYPQTISYLDAYRRLRPDGRVYCASDMNRHWLERFDFSLPKMQTFAAQIDVVTASCTAMRDSLNRQKDVAFPCYLMTNGFYNTSNTEINADYKYKQNIILTVGRIGLRAKNNEELLIAFAKVSERLKNWSLRLVGPIEPAFHGFINEYFTLRPDLRERVIFTGSIVDKKQLYGEYANAKIFALTSRVEGAPNVYAEALHHGCMFITSNIDAAEDITKQGLLGVSYPVGDINALCAALIQKAENSDYAAFAKHIPTALAYGKRKYCWQRNAKKIAYMLYS